MPDITEGRSKINLVKSLLYMIFIIYILMLFKVVLFKNTSLISFITGSNITKFRSYNLIPFQTVADFMNMGKMNILRIFSNLFGNIGVFMPLGYLLPVLFKKVNKLSKVVIIALSLSIFFEGSQFVFYLGTLDVDDLMLNTIGAISGYGVYLVFKKYIKEEKVFNIFTVVLSVVAFIIAFTIAKEEFGNLLGITKHETEITGDKDIPKDRFDTRGTFISFKENKIEMFDSVVSKNASEKDFLKKIRTIVNDETKIYYYDTKESKNKSVVNYKKLSYDDLSKVKENSIISVWNNKNNPYIASVIVLSKPIESTEGVTSVGDNSSTVKNKDNADKPSEIVLNGVIEKITENGIDINMRIVTEHENGSSTSTIGRGDAATIVSVEFKKDTTYNLKVYNRNDKMIEDKNISKDEIELNLNAKLKGIKKGNIFVASHIELTKIVD